MSEHKAHIRWKRDSSDFSYKTYNREHVWAFDGGIEVRASANPKYLGKEDCVDPEEAFVAALSSCHMLTFLAVASMKGFVIDSYDDEAVGHMDKNENGRTAITRVDLNPKAAFTGDKQPSRQDLDEMHEKAHKECFIANSVTTEIKVNY